MKTIMTIAVTTLLVCVGPASATPPLDGRIVIYRMTVAADGSVGDAVVPSCGVPMTPIFGGLASKAAFGVFVERSGATPSGISAAELYISGLEAGTDLPAGWTKTVTYATGTIATGSIDEPTFVGQEVVRRGFIAWSVSGPDDPNCQTTALVLLARVEIQSPFGSPAFPKHDHELSIGAGNPPSNPAFSCPVLYRCDAPIFQAACAPFNRFVLNPGVGGPGGPGVVADPYPPDAATNVARDVQLSWVWVPGDDCTPTAWMAILDIGTDPEHLVRSWEPPYCGTRKCFTPPTLAPNTTYYWRASGGYATGPLWRFTTGEVIAVGKTTWGHVKRLYR